MTNSTLCRIAAQNYINQSSFPVDDGLKLKVYKLGLSQAMCGANFKDQKKADSFSFYDRTRQDSAEETKDICVKAVLKSMKILGRSDCDGKNDTLDCRQYIIEDVKQTTLQIEVAEKAHIQAKQAADQGAIEAQQQVEALKTKK